MPAGPTRRACPRGDHCSAELCPCPPGGTPGQSPCTRLPRNRTASRPLYTSHWHDASRHREGLITIFSSKQRARAGNPGKLGIQAEAAGRWGGSGAMMGGHARHGRERGLQRQVPSCSTAEHQPRPRASFSSGFQEQELLLLSLFPYFNRNMRLYG